MSTIRGAGLGLSQKTRIQPGSPTLVAEAQTLEPLSISFGVHISRQLELVAVL